MATCYRVLGVVSAAPLLGAGAFGGVPGLHAAVVLGHAGEPLCAAADEFLLHAGTSAILLSATLALETC